MPWCSYVLKRRPQAHPVFDAIQKRLRDECETETSSYQRLYPGWRQRAEGAWVWCCRITDSGIELGSPYPATQFLRCKTIDWGDDGTLYPEEHDVESKPRQEVDDGKER
jgi:hypothetical protein